MWNCLSKIKLMPVDDDWLWWMVLEDVEYADPDTANVETIIVPAGFVTNLASIPSFLWSHIPPQGNYAPAAILHDYLYRLNGQIDSPKTYTRKQSDAIFKSAMLASGVRPFRAWYMHCGVRLGGWKPWNRYKKQHETVSALSMTHSIDELYIFNQSYKHQISIMTRLLSRIYWDTNLNHL